MKDSCDHAPRSNPFSTRFVRPGAVPYLFAPGQSADGLVRRLAGLGWRGQIIGPHGSGKSTLLAALAEPLARAGRRSWTVSLHDGARRLPAGWIRQAQRAGANQIVVDGYEQLSALNRFFVKAQCRWRGWGLLASAHGDVGFPTLLLTASDPATAQALVRRLLSGEDGPITPELVAQCFAARGGNVRETLFALYDRWRAPRG
ncbi:MAG: hypothetical protein WD063_02700 [Pirellulales bacterium]